MTTIYDPFLAEAIALLEQHLDLSPYPIPAGFESKSAVTGKGKRQATATTTSYGACTPKLRQIRAAHVQGGEALQVLNFVIFPQLNYDLPFFGADLVTLPGGHLIALDMQPLFQDEAYQAKYSQPVMEMFHQYQRTCPGAATFQKKRRHFSLRPSYGLGQRISADVRNPCFLRHFEDYLKAYMGFCRSGRTHY